MSELRSAIEELRAEVLAEQPDAMLEEDFAELHRAVALLDVERLRRLAEIDRRRLFERDGHLSTASWLASRFKVAWGAAREQIRIARGLEEMPVTRRAVDDGDLSMSGLRVLASVREADPEAFRARNRCSWTPVGPLGARPRSRGRLLAPGRGTGSRRGQRGAPAGRPPPSTLP